MKGHKWCPDRSGRRNERLEGENSLWEDKLRNEKVLRRIGGQMTTLGTIRKRKMNWLCQYTRRDCQMACAMEGTINGKRGGEEQEDFN